MYWRRPSSAPDDPQFAVDKEGRLILGNWEWSQDDFIILNFEGNIMTNERRNSNYPALNQWGNSPVKAAFSGDSDTKVDYDGQHYVIAMDGSTITPELHDYE